MEKRATSNVRSLAWVTCILLIIGGLNWGLMGLMDWNLINYLLGAFPMVEKAVYILIGVAALVHAYLDISYEW